MIRYPHMFLVYHTHATRIVSCCFQRPDRKSIHLRKILRHPLCSCCMANMNTDARQQAEQSWLSCSEVLGRNEHYHNIHQHRIHRYNMVNIYESVLYTPEITWCISPQTWSLSWNQHNQRWNDGPPKEVWKDLVILSNLHSSKLT